MKAVHGFTEYMCVELQVNWDWSDLLEFTQSSDLLTKW